MKESLIEEKLEGEKMENIDQEEQKEIKDLPEPKDNNIEKGFYKFLKDKGIKVEIESNGVLDDISKEN